jgi:hypothetical protein
MKKIALLVFSIVSILSSVSTAQVSNNAELEQYLLKNSKLYSVFNKRENSKQLAKEMLNGISYRLSRYSSASANEDLVKSKGLLFCTEMGAGLILVKGSIYACEVFDVKAQKLGKAHFVWAYSVDFKLRNDRSKIIDTFKNIIGNGMTLLKLDKLFVLSGNVGLAMGYAWGDDYQDYTNLTLKKGYISSKFQVVNGWGAGLQIMKPKENNGDLHVVLGSVLVGSNGTELGSKSTIKFRKGIQLKAKGF